MVGLEPPGDSTSERWKNYIKNKESTNKVKTSKTHPNYDGQAIKDHERNMLAEQSLKGLGCIGHRVHGSNEKKKNKMAAMAVQSKPHPFVFLSHRKEQFGHTAVATTFFNT